MSEHTAGKWYYKVMGGDPNSDRWMFYVQSGESEICGGAVSNLSSKDPGEMEANARLIIAAPDLLAALVALDATWDFSEPIMDNESLCFQDASYVNRAYLLARAAIAKARGE